MPVYYAKSAVVSKTVIFNVLAVVVVIAELKEVINIIPAGWMPFVTAAVAAINVILRSGTVRPISWSIKPGEAKPVPVQNAETE